MGCQFRDQSEDSSPIMSTILDDGRSGRHSSVCSVYGLHHYTTLDGAKYFFPGECTYSMVAQKGGTFHVMVNHRFGCDVANERCKKSVRIEVGGMNTIMLYPNNTATYNGRLIKLPKTVENTIILESIGEYTTVRLASGVRIIFDNDQSVDVVVPDIFKNDVFGLCGN